MSVAWHPERGIARCAPLASSLLVAAMASLTACSGTATNASDVAGNWTGMDADSKSGVTGPLAASFSEESGSLTGTLTISSGWLCSVANQGNVSGTYQITSGVCAGGSGSFSLSR
jgi:hypothetical protein